MITAVLMFLVWGSYLNSVGYRLLHLNAFFKKRSFCPSCKHTIFWYDNIPVISWLLLNGQCRFCKNSISWLYPTIELMTTISLLALWCTIPQKYFPVYALFFSALIVTIRTDLDRMLISRYMTLYLIPAGLLASYCGVIPLSLTESMLGCIFGYLILWLTKKISLMITKQESLGQGDVELLSFIGAFTGPVGCWASLSIGSISGTVVTSLYMLITKQSIVKIPFGAYLGAGAMMFVLFENYLYLFF